MEKFRVFCEPVMFPVVLIADGVIDRKSGVRVSDESPLSVPTELAARPTEDLADQQERLSVEDGGVRGEALLQPRPGHHGEVKMSWRPGPGLVITLTGDIGMARVTHPH